ncbi:hypothetical protein Tco_1312267 [Tanacetum coccineum]
MTRSSSPQPTATEVRGAGGGTTSNNTLLNNDPTKRYSQQKVANFPKTTTNCAHPKEQTRGKPGYCHGSERLRQKVSQKFSPHGSASSSFPDFNCGQHGGGATYH